MSYETNLCGDFLAALASRAPAPGGGTAAAMSGAMAAALASMVCQLTVGNPKFAEQKTEIEAILQETDQLRTTLVWLMQQDTDAFLELMACYKMPKETEMQKSLRRVRIQETAKNAALAPLAAMRACLRVLELVERTAKLGNPQAVSDAAVSALLARAGLQSAFYNVKINTSIISDTDFNETTLAEANDLLDTAFSIEKNVLAEAERRM